MKFEPVSKTTLDAYSEHPRSMFVMVEFWGDWCVVCHRDTKVMYVVGRNSGTFTMLVNADGTPLLWKRQLPSY